MKSNDFIKRRDDIRQKLMKAIKDDDSEAFSGAFVEMQQCVADELKEQFQAELSDMQQTMDSKILSARGVRQLTSAERKYYNDLAQAMKSRDPRQALTNIEETMPETIINSVFEDLSSNHELLSAISFVPSTGAVKTLINTNGEDAAVWGKLTDEIVKEILGGFKVVDTSLFKLSAFLPVAKSMLDLGPEWLDRFIRETLYEQLALGLEFGIVNGDGDDEPIGMTRETGEGVSVVGGAYPRKAQISITDFSATTFGKLLSMMAVDDYGKARAVNGLILLVNSQDYFEKVMPATTFMAPDGTYRNDVLPYPTKVIQTSALNRGEAVLGMAKRYFAAIGTEQGGKIDYDDSYRFLEDERVYLIKAYANGMPKDNSSFVFLDISDLRPSHWKVEMVTAPEPSTDATLASLSLGEAALEPAFAAETDTYTASTKNETNMLRATATDIGASIKVTLNDTPAENFSALKWNAGSNTLKLDVTAADGESTKSYTVTVTKS